MEDYLGKLKVYTAETTLVDPAKKLRLDWTLKEYSGCKALKPGTKETFKNLGDLVVGTEFEFFGFFGETIHMPIIAVNGKKADADNGSWGAFLEFDTDDRHCWVVCGAYDSQAMKKISFK